MIERYSLPEMKKIWAEQNRFQQMLEVEIYAAEAMCDMGLVPKDAYEDIRTKARFDLQRIAEIEEVTRHDVIAFLRLLLFRFGNLCRGLFFPERLFCSSELRCGRYLGPE